MCQSILSISLLSGSDLAVMDDNGNTIKSSTLPISTVEIKIHLDMTSSPPPPCSKKRKWSSDYWGIPAPNICCPLWLCHSSFSKLYLMNPSLLKKKKKILIRSCILALCTALSLALVFQKAFLSSCRPLPSPFLIPRGHFSSFFFFWLLPCFILYPTGFSDPYVKFRLGAAKCRSRVSSQTNCEFVFSDNTTSLPVKGEVRTINDRNIIMWKKRLHEEQW